MGTETTSVCISERMIAKPYDNKEQIMIRGLVVSSVLGSLFCVITHKLNLTVGVIPSLNVAAGLLGFFSVTTWIALDSVVACYDDLAFSGVTGQRPKKAQSRPDSNTTNTPKQSKVAQSWPESNTTNTPKQSENAKSRPDANTTNTSKQSEENQPKKRDEKKSENRRIDEPTSQDISGLTIQSGTVNGDANGVINSGDFKVVTRQRPTEAQSRPDANTTNNQRPNEPANQANQKIRGFTIQSGTINGNANGAINLRGGNFEIRAELW